MKENTKTQSFTKSDLRTGDVCIQRNGLVEKFMSGTPFGDTFYVKGGGMNGADCVTSDLLWEGDSTGKFAIDSVYRPTHEAVVGKYNYKDEDDFECVFSRGETEQRTTKETEKFEEKALNDLRDIAEVASLMLGKKITVTVEDSDASSAN